MACCIIYITEYVFYNIWHEKNLWKTKEYAVKTHNSGEEKNPFWIKCILIKQNKVIIYFQIRNAFSSCIHRNFYF